MAARAGAASPGTGSAVQITHMNPEIMVSARGTGAGPFRLCFRSLFNRGRGYAFPCDGNGRVDLDELSERARSNYFYARAMVGRELAVPAVELTELR